MSLPDGYFERLYEVEQEHWWHRGMREISAAVLGSRLTGPGRRLLDAGCGTGGFLGWASVIGAPDRLCGVDASSAAIALAQRRVPAAELSVAEVRELPFETAGFDLVALNDVLQHIYEDEVAESLKEVRRVLAPGGVLLVRTNGGLRARRERPDWRLYDRRQLVATLERSGLCCERVTHGNAVPSVWAAARKRGPRAPSNTSHGIPAPDGRLVARVGYALLRAEARVLRNSVRALPYGHTLIAVARREL